MTADPEASRSVARLDPTALEQDSSAGASSDHSDATETDNRAADRLDRVFRFGCTVLWAALFLAFCRLDSGPRPWDEAFFLFQPTAVVTALREHGLLEALDAFWNTSFHKGPLASYTNIPVMAMFGSGPVAIRVDNLILFLVAAWGLHRFLTRQGVPRAAATLAFTGVLGTPFLNRFTRLEVAELHVWVTALWTLLALHCCHDFRNRKGSLWFGLAAGFGMLAKLSFPVVTGAAIAWVVARSLVRGHRDGSLGYRVGNMVRAALLGGLIFLPPTVKNWEAMYRHASAQFGLHAREYGLGDPHSADYFTYYFTGWLEWIGGFWLLLATCGLGLLAVSLRWHRQRVSVEAGKGARGLVPILLVCFVTNLVYCYHHPVFDLRFTVGSFLAFQILSILAFGWSLVRLDQGNARWPYTLSVLPLIMLLAGSYVSPSGSPVLAVESRWIGTNPRVLDLESGVPDLRGAVIDLVSYPSRRPQVIALAGDHIRLNNDNIRLEMLRRGILGDVWQAGYQEPTSMSGLERVRRLAGAQTWVVFEAPTDAPGVSWVQRFVPDVLAVLKHNPDYFEELPFPATNELGHPIRAFRRIRWLDGGLRAPGQPPAPFVWVSEEQPAPSRPVPTLRWKPEQNSGLTADGRPVFFGEQERVAKATVPTLAIPGDTVWSLRYRWSPEHAGPLPDPRIGHGFITTESAHFDVFLDKLDTPRTFRTSVAGSHGLAAGVIGLPLRMQLASCELLPVSLEHRDFGLCVLGQGEWISGNEYRFQSGFHDGQSVSRCVARHDGRFHTDHFVCAPGGFLELNLDLGGLSVGDCILDLGYSGSAAPRVTATADGIPVTLSRSSDPPQGLVRWVSGAESSWPTRVRIRPPSDLEGEWHLYRLEVGGVCRGKHPFGRSVAVGATRTNP